MMNRLYKTTSSYGFETIDIINETVNIGFYAPVKLFDFAKAFDEVYY